MSELLRKAYTFGSDSPRIYSASEPSNIDPYSTWVAADENLSLQGVDLPCRSQQRQNNDICDSALASSSHSRPDSPVSHSPTHVAPTLESLADALTIEQTALSQHPSCPSPLPDPPLPCQKRPREKKSLLDWLKRYSPSVTLENRGSVARDHLASERTFLAYVRTSLALASTGVALVQLLSIADLNFGLNKVPLSATTRTVHKFAKSVGITAIILALILLVIGEFFVLRADRRWGLLISNYVRRLIQIFSHPERSYSQQVSRCPSVRRLRHFLPQCPCGCNFRSFIGYEVRCIMYIQVQLLFAFTLEISRIILLHSRQPAGPFFTAGT
jgi:uncharacterized membrane protein YidH (DUF202 family)